MKRNLYDSLKNYCELDDRALTAILDKMYFKSFDRNYIIYEPGKLCDHVYFILNGVGMTYYENNLDNKYVISFFHENDWLEDISSMHLDVPMNYYLATIEKCEMLALKKEDFFELQKEFPEFKEALNKMYINYLRTIQMRYTNQVAATARERYDDFIKHNSTLALRLPQKLLASFLGITPEFLSKMRGMKI